LKQGKVLNVFYQCTNCYDFLMSQKMNKHNNCTTKVSIKKIK